MPATPRIRPISDATFEEMESFELGRTDDVSAGVSILAWVVELRLDVEGLLKVSSDELTSTLNALTLMFINNILCCRLRDTSSRNAIDGS